MNLTSFRKIWTRNPESQIVFVNLASFRKIWTRNPESEIAFGNLTSFRKIWTRNPESQIVFVNLTSFRKISTRNPESQMLGKSQKSQHENLHRWNLIYVLVAGRPLGSVNCYTWVICPVAPERSRTSCDHIRRHQCHFVRLCELCGIAFKLCSVFKNDFFHPIVLPETSNHVISSGGRSSQDLDEPSSKGGQGIWRF